MQKIKKIENVTTVFVKLDKPKSIRKLLLSNALNTAKTLRSYSQVKSLKEEKFSTINKLKNSCSQIKNMINSLERKLPKIPLDYVESKSKKIEKTKLESKTDYSDSEVFRLKSELEDIERKLNSL